MQPGNNTIRPTSGDGVWLESNNGSPQQDQKIIYKNVEKTIFKKTSKRRLERLLLASCVVIFALFVALCITSYFVMGEKGDICFSPECIKAAAILLESMDSSVNPCDNFYAFACGNWRKTHISPDPAFINNWFQESYKIVARDTVDYLKRNNSDDEPKSVHEARLVYRTCMDFESMEETGLPTLLELLDNLGLPRNPLTKSELIQPWPRTLAKIRRYLSLELLIGSGVLPAMTNSTINQIIIGPPEEDEYIPGTKWRWENKEETKKFRKKIKEESEQIVKGWKNYATKIIEYVISSNDNRTVLKKEDLENAAIRLLDFQQKLLMVEDNDTVKEAAHQEFSDMYTIEKIQQVADNATHNGTSKVNFKEFIDSIYEGIIDETLTISPKHIIMVRSVPYMEILSQIVEDIDDKNIELFLWWNVVYSVAPHVNEDLKELKRIFVKKIMEEGASESRSEVCMQTVSYLMNSVVGYRVKEFAEKETISEITEMLQNVRGSFANFIYALDWMDDSTKYATVDKLYKMNMFIGYPAWFNDKEIMNDLYTNTTLTNTTHLLNVLNLIEIQTFEEFGALFDINDSIKDEYDPLDVNAYYSPSLNSITVPYGILQQPYHHMGLEALNYGAIGTVLGHEITHGFDNTGRMYDKFGNYRIWWSNYSTQEYIKRESCYEQAYTKFYIESIEANVDGSSTLGENIADDGGVRDALAAYRSYVKKHGKEAKLPGFLNYTHEQLFFLSFGNMWCSEYSNDALLRSLEEDEHSPNFVRVLVVLQNFLDFSVAWNCPKGSYMNPEIKCKLWI